MSSRRSELVAELAKRFAQHLFLINAGWSRGFYRFRSTGGRYGGNASVVSATGVELINSIVHSEFVHGMNDLARDLFTQLGKEEGVLLLEIDNQFNFNIRYDWEDLTRWEINKLDGRTGIPAE